MSLIELNMSTSLIEKQTGVTTQIADVNFNCKLRGENDN